MLQPWKTILVPCVHVFEVVDSTAIDTAAQGKDELLLTPIHPSLCVVYSMVEHYLHHVWRIVMYVEY